MGKCERDISKTIIKRDPCDDEQEYNLDDKCTRNDRTITTSKTAERPNQNIESSLREVIARKRNIALSARLKAGTFHKTLQAAVPKQQGQKPENHTDNTPDEA